MDEINASSAGIAIVSERHGGRAVWRSAASSACWNDLSWVYRQRFLEEISLPAVERFYRLARACCAFEKALREPFEGFLDAMKPRLAAGKGQTGLGRAVKRNGMMKVFPVDGCSGKASVFVRDPGRNVIEFTQPPKAGAP